MKKRDELENNLKQNISQKQTPDGFIKVTDNPVSGLSSDQKVILSRKANAMFNNGNIMSLKLGEDWKSIGIPYIVLYKKIGE